jgi:hypothetical protein
MNIPYSQLICFSSATYNSFEEAKQCGAIYSTPSTIDCLGDGESVSGILDILEVLTMITDCVGVSGSVTYGVMKGEVFIELADIIAESNSEQ